MRPQGHGDKAPPEEVKPVAPLSAAEQRRAKRMQEAAARRKAEDDEIELRAKRRKTPWGRMYQNYLDKKVCPLIIPALCWAAVPIGRAPLMTGSFGARPPCSAWH